MEMKCRDAIFGDMEYRHGWVKKETLSMFGKEYPVTIHAKAYSGKKITEEQRLRYRNFCRNQKEILKETERQVQEYIRINMDEIAPVCADLVPENAESIAETVTLKILLITQDGDLIMLFDCAWDIEHGFAVQVYPEYKSGSQDLFL